MISHCPKCNKALTFTASQLDKIQSALVAMTSGTLKLKCPHCKVPMELLSDGTLADWRQKPRVGGGSPKKMPPPPQPPDINWLTESAFKETETIQDIPKVLVLIDPGSIRDSVMGAMVELFFQPVAVETRNEAAEKMQAVQFDSVVMHSNFDGEFFKHSKIYETIKRMPMARRRHLFFVLIGQQFSTLYSLEALTHSANMVVNEKDVVHMKNIYKKGKAESDELFRPYINILKERGVGGA